MSRDVLYTVEHKLPFLDFVETGADCVIGQSDHAPGPGTARGPRLDAKNL